MYVRRLRINATVTATGGASQAFYTDQLTAGGYLERVTYRNGTASGLSTAAHINVIEQYMSSGVGTDGPTHLSVSTTGTTAAAGEYVNFYPRIAQQTTAGAAFAYTSAATPPSIPDRIPLAAGDRIKLEVTSAGNTSNGGKRATFDFYISGN